MTTVRHLPAIVIRATDEVTFTMVAACGKRGSLATRDAAEAGQLQFVVTGPQVCPECMVRWDAAEEAGRLRVVWHIHPRTEWTGIGAVLWAECPPPWRCAKCGAPAGGSNGFSPHCLAVVVREDRSAVRRLSAAEKPSGASTPHPASAAPRERS